MDFWADKDILKKFLSARKREDLKCFIIFFFTELLILSSSYTRFAEYKFLFYALTLPMCIAYFFLMGFGFTKSILGRLNTLTFLNYTESEIYVEYVRFYFFHRKGKKLKIDNAKISPRCYYYTIKKKDYECYSLYISIDGRNFYIPQDFFPEFEVLENLLIKNKNIKFIKASPKINRLRK